MKILHLRASNFYGGPERQLHFHARLAGRSSFDVTISSFLENGKAPEFVEVIAGDGLSTHVFEVSSAYDRRTVSLVKEYLRSTGTQILCTHDYRTHVVGLLATRRTNTSWLAFSRGYTKDNLKVRLFHALDKGIIRLADHIVAVSEGQKRRLQRLMISGKNISVAYNAISPDAFTSVDPVNLQRKFGLPDDAVMAIAAGRFSREKGQLVLIEAAAAALRRKPQLRFILFGDGPDFEVVKKRITSLGCAETILCPGHEKNLIGCLKGADLLINPSLSEGLPNIVLEGMALQVPVVATAVGGVPEMITDRVSGRLVPAGDAAALADAIVEAVEDVQAGLAWREKALATIHSRFSFEGQFERISAAYRLVGGEGEKS